ncbi:NAD+ synthase [Chitinophagales bacterium]|nr:NAD+ synthase [Chitinophagales bacterium]
MKFAIAQLNYHIGNFESNFEKMRVAIEDAKNMGAELIVFGELAVCGYPPRDFLEFSDFILQGEEVLEKLKALSDTIGIIVGAPTRNPVVEGKDLFNSAYFFYQGSTLHVAHKALLPTYDIFDEYRYFEPAKEFSVIEFKGHRIALTVCEDIWNIGNENPMYEICPMDEMMDQKPDLMINVSASPFDYNHAQARLDIVKKNVERYGIPMIYSNNVGAQTEVVFDGGSIVMDNKSGVVQEMPYFKEAMQLFDTDKLYLETATPNQLQPKEKMMLIHDAVVSGVRDYFQKLGFTKAILGLSGGLDSALTAVLACRALGAKNVMCVLMPSEYSSDHSVNDSLDLVKNLGCLHKIISIEDGYNTMLGTLQPHFEGKGFNVAEENIQARLRGLILMGLSNKHGYILLNTTNKSEAAVGYGTLYGDMCGGLSVIGDIYKTEAFELCRWINRDKEVVPVHIIEKPPSAELRPDQKDSDSLPPYDQLDEILFQYIENRLGPKEITARGFDAKLVERILRLVNRSEYKRYQTPPMIRVSSKAFGVGRRMPIVGKYLS